MAAADAIFQAVKNRLWQAVRLPRRNLRWGLVLCIGTIALCFSAASLALLLFETQEAHARAEAAEMARAEEIARGVGGTLSHFAATGLLFANGGLAEEAVSALPGIRGIAVSDDRGTPLRASGEFIDTMALAPLMHGRRLVTGSGRTGLIAFQDLDRLIFLSIEPAALTRTVLPQNAELISRTGVILAGDGRDTGDAEGQQIRVDTALGWPVSVRVTASPTPYHFGLLPLYAFLIAGPPAIAVWLTLLFLRETDRRARDAREIRTLRRIQPGETRLRMRLALSERQASETLQARSRLYARLAQGLCIPLNAICGFAQMIAQEMSGPAGTPRTGEYARFIDTCGRQIHTQIEQMAELAAIESGSLRFTAQSCDAAELTAAVIRSQSGLAYKRHVRIELPPVTAIEVHVDPDATARAIAMLLSAALERTERDGTIQVQISEETGAAVIRLADTGKAAFKASTRTTPDDITTWITAELVRRTGGALKASSPGGKGNLIELRLPKA